MEIRLATLSEASHIDTLLQSCKADMDSKGIFQWTDVYPGSAITLDDIDKNQLHVLDDGEIVGLVVLNEDQEPEYVQVDWIEQNGKAMVVHRLAVAPEYQGRGYAKMLMDFAEEYAVDHNYTSIRLDAFTQNPRVLKFYEMRNYQIRGPVYFEGRTAPFYCLELDISQNI